MLRLLRYKESTGINNLQILYCDWVCTVVISNDVMKDLRS